MSTTTQSAMVNVMVKKDHGLGNQHPTLMGKRDTLNVVNHNIGWALCVSVKNADSKGRLMNFRFMTKQKASAVMNATTAIAEECRNIIYRTVIAGVSKHTTGIMQNLKKSVFLLREERQKTPIRGQETLHCDMSLSKLMEKNVRAAANQIRYFLQWIMSITTDSIIVKMSTPAEVPICTGGLSVMVSQEFFNCYA